MLALCFSIDDSTYAIPASRIDEVMPMIRFPPTPSSTPVLRGIMEYHDDTLPVIDVCQILAQRECRQLMSTRMIVTRTRCGEDKHRIALVAERVHETLDLDDCQPGNLTWRDMELDVIDGIYHHDGDIVQLLRVDALLPESVRHGLSVKER